MNHNIRKILFVTILVILLFSIYSSFSISLTDFNEKDICPKLFGIPACYLVLIFFILALVAHLLKSIFLNNLWFYGFISIPFLLALSGTLIEISGTTVCPQTPGGTPMCYISLGICISLIILKLGECKIK